MSREKKLPSGRVARFGQFGGIVTNVLGNMAIDGVKQLSRGKVPAVKDLLLSGKNISHLAERLAQLRGAAMKMGQILSMDAGELLTPELAELLSVLRDNAYTLPEPQLLQALTDYLGHDWRSKFRAFDLTPFAAASIGQVHTAVTLSGKHVAVKLQYPDIAKSIHSDVDNMGALMKMSGLIPKHVDMTRVLLEVKMQLIREADYDIEARYLCRYGKLLSTDPAFVVPQFISELSNEKLLTMEFLKGENIESIVQLPAPEKQQYCRALIRLLFTELFDFKLMQTDPNFANYLFLPAQNKIGLLDFGATREIDNELSTYYREVAHAILLDDMELVLEKASEVGFFVADLPVKFKADVLATLKIAAEPMQYDGDFDFGYNDVLSRLRDRALALSRQRDYYGTPPGDSIFVHRKIGGMYLLLCRLKVKLNLRAILQEFIGP